MLEDQIDLAGHEPAQLLHARRRHEVADLAQSPQRHLAERELERHLGAHRGRRQRAERRRAGARQQRRVERRLQARGEMAHEIVERDAAQADAFGAQAAFDQRELLAHRPADLAPLEHRMHGIAEVGAGDRREPRELRVFGARRRRRLPSRERLRPRAASIDRRRGLVRRRGSPRCDVDPALQQRGKTPGRFERRIRRIGQHAGGRALGGPRRVPYRSCGHDQRSGRPLNVSHLRRRHRAVQQALDHASSGARSGSVSGLRELHTSATARARRHGTRSARASTRHRAAGSARPGLPVR